MSDAGAIATLAGLTSTALREPDVGDVLAGLVAACADALDAGAVALLAYDERGRLSLLSASSHASAELEMLQIQRTAGPCVECIAADLPIETVGGDALVERWAEVGQAIVSAGFESVTALPMRWRGRAIGGLNIFGDVATSLSEERTALGQVFADISAMVIACAGPDTWGRFADSMHSALAAREVVEQAKGVIAYRENVDLGAAHGVLLRRARESGTSLTRTAELIVGDQR